MPLLDANELTTRFYPKAANMAAGDLDTYLLRANAFCLGVIGGVPPAVDDTVKAAVGLAFEILAKSETDQVDPVTGNITPAAPEGAFVRNKQADPLQTVRDMLAAAKRAFDNANTAQAERGVRFL